MSVIARLHQAALLDNDWQTDEALDLVYAVVDEGMKGGRFADIDSALSGIAVSDVSNDFLLGLMSATLPAKDKLKNRAAFYQASVEEVKRRQAKENGLLAGLA